MIDLFIDEPMVAVRDRFNKFRDDLKRARNERRKIVPERTMTAAEAKDDEFQKQVKEINKGLHKAGVRPHR